MKLAILTRSLLHIRNTMPAQVDVTTSDIAEGREIPALDTGALSSEAQRLPFITIPAQ